MCEAMISHTLRRCRVDSSQLLKFLREERDGAAAVGYADINVRVSVEDTAKQYLCNG